MRILYVITRAKRGGAQTHVLQLAQAAAVQNEVMVAVGEDGFLCERLRVLGIDYRILSHLRHSIALWDDVSGLAEIASLIRRFEPDIVHVHSGKAGLLGRLASALCGVPSVYTAHGFAFGAESPLSRRVSSLAGEHVGARAGAFTIAVSQAECRLAIGHKVTRKTRIAVIYNGTEETGLRAVPEADPPVIAMVARFAYPKQQELLISAFSRLNANARLWLIGDGPGLSAAKQAARRSEAGDRILFWGERDDVRQLLAQVQIAALISAQEGFGLCLIESMSVGLPLIATDAGGMREVVRHGQTGLLVRNGDEAHLTAALDQLVADPKARRQMGNAGLAHFRANFTAAHMIQRTFSVYHRVLNRCHEDSGLGCASCTFPVCNGAQVSGD